MIKQVIVMRTVYPLESGSKKIRRGKEIAQACHASLSFLTRKIQALLDRDIKESVREFFARRPFDDPAEAYVAGFMSAIELLNISATEREWIDGIFTKICLKVESEEELLEIEKKAMEKGLRCHVITDRGLTEFKGVPTITCLALGPDRAEKIDEITRGLELY
ncbi:hypothetical protein EBT16_01420 [bacterium]|nr:hypothetical protein [bacterium]